jgi:hypothetical protein
VGKSVGMSLYVFSIAHLHWSGCLSMHGIRGASRLCGWNISELRAMVEVFMVLAIQQASKLLDLYL